jgi:hypothetical protein
VKFHEAEAVGAFNLTIRAVGSMKCKIFAKHRSFAVLTGGNCELALLTKNGTISLNKATAFIENKTNLNVFGNILELFASQHLHLATTLMVWTLHFKARDIQS